MNAFIAGSTSWGWPTWPWLAARMPRAAYDTLGEDGPARRRRAQ